MAELAVHPFTPPPRPPERAHPPIPRQEVLGEDDSRLAHLAHHASRLAIDALGRLPEPLLAASVGGLARFSKLVDGRHARAARSFLRHVFPTESEREIERRVLQCYRHFLGIVVDSGRFNRRVLGPRAAERYTFELGEDARRLVERGPPCVLATGHLGDWEASAQGLELLGLGPLYAVAKPPKNRPMSIALQDAREARGMHLLPRRGAMQFAATIAEAGASLGLLLDQRARKKPVLAPFFGRPARCDRSAGVLLRRLRVPVLIYACLRGERPLSYRIVCPAVLWPDELAGASPEEIAGRINAVLERMILAHPDQYFWLHDRYRDTPLELPDARAGSAPRADDPDETPPRATSRG